jgi:hypothetical protein
MAHQLAPPPTTGTRPDDGRLVAIAGKAPVLREARAGVAGHSGTSERGPDHPRDRRQLARDEERPPRAARGRTTMADDQAGWWVAAGLAQTLGGMILMNANDPFLLTLWGVALLLTGSVTTVVGAGAWLHLWR